jgi:hypothetical protein
MFAADVSTPMLDDGAHGDGAAGDGVYGATIPAQTASTLVRFKVEATNTDGVFSSPSVDNSMNYHGYMVQDPSVTSNAPIINWFMDDADYNDMLANHVQDDAKIPTVIVYGNDVYDNSEIGIRGEISRTYSKKGYKVWLPSGYMIQPNGAELAINEFRLSADFKSETLAAVPTGWWALKQAGLPTPDIVPTRIQRNGQFEGTYIYMDKYETEWKDANGYDDGQLYEDWVEKVQGDPSRADIEQWRTELLLDRADPAKRDNALDMNNVPNITTHMAMRGLLATWDHYSNNNTFQYSDSEDTDRWSLMYWDIDSMFTTGRVATDLSPYDRAWDIENGTRFAQQSIYDQPDLREAYFRRVRTLADKFYTDGELKAKYNEFADRYASEVAMDVAKWTADPYFRMSREREERAIDTIQETTLAYLRQPWAVPPAQTQQERQQVTLNEVNYDGDPANEYVKLSNGASTAVDISDWYIEGIDYTIPAGAVIPKGGSIYILKSDKAYRATHPSVLVAGQYQNSLGSSGGQLKLKTDTDFEIDTYNY